MALKLGSDEHVVPVGTDLLPKRARGIWRVAGQIANDEKLSLGENLDQRCAVKLTNSDELTARVGVRPTPGRGTGPTVRVGGRATELGVVDEVVQVHVLAAEALAWVAGDGVGLAVDTLGVVQARPLRGVKQTGLALGLPVG